MDICGFGDQLPDYVIEAARRNERMRKMLVERSTEANEPSTVTGKGRAYANGGGEILGEITKHLASLGKRGKRAENGL